MDRWQTTSEVSARHLESSTVVKTDPFAYDRFEFFIRLADFMGRIWDRTLHLCVRYSAEGYGEMWDNNGGRNYTVVFKRKPFSQIREFGRDEKAGAAVLRGVSAMDDDDDDDDDEDGIGARMKVAALKKTLEKVMPSNGSSLGVTGMGTPSSGARAAPAPVDQPNQSGSFHQSGPPAFVNSRSAHDVLLRLGKQHSPTQSPVLPPSPSPRRMFYISGNDVPLSPRRAHKEGSLAGRYDLGSSLKNAATGGHTPEKSPLAPANSIPFPSTGSPSRSPVSPHGMPPGSSFINQKFTSTPVTFSRVRSTSRGSPRDAALLTPGGESDQGTVKSGFWALSHSPPFRTSSDTDIPASLHSSGPSTPFESQIAHGNTGSKGKGAVGDAANKGNTQRGYFALPVRGGKKIGSKTTVSSSLTKGFHTDPTEKDAGDALVPPPTVSRFLPIPKATNTNHNMSYDVSPSISPPFSDAGWSGFDSAMDDIHRNTTSTVPFVPTSSSTALRTLSPERRDGPSRESSSDDISSASSTVPATSSDASNSTALSTPSPPSPTETSLTPKEDEIARNTNETQNLHSILDQFCFYTGPGSIGGTRRSHSTSSVDEFFAQGGHVVPEIPLLDHSGRTTPIPYNSHYNIQRSPGAHSPNARNNARSAESTVRMQPIAG
ncbi:uncharacterized protein EI90DRAFT_2987431 [Cantharellus anzutake]|uniref:uncharacterized protein n=1 Tax=Cantharellus anzutake TaxID=1750568 RepID=UPI001905D8BE|nr:uncharacterized protein EI90DRAFT_2987431 [Cantharellus anzutake]KAF8344127.1 hypothetical protein EI90DRAFT_2987431 [Cantharellus anzutake]